MNTKNRLPVEIIPSQASRPVVSPAAIAGTRYSVAPPPSYSLTIHRGFVPPHLQGDYDPAMKTSAVLKSLSDSVPSEKWKLLSLHPRLHGQPNELPDLSRPSAQPFIHDLAIFRLERSHKSVPKFKTRQNISVAAGWFSKWLSQFENLNTDV